uniref:CVNH domain-containing protein n=1 Tax=Globodera pallida TaxID=36090 RepID=A0A183CAY2_GLOPA
MKGVVAALILLLVVSGRFAYCDGNTIKCLYGKKGVAGIGEMKSKECRDDGHYYFEATCAEGNGHIVHIEWGCSLDTNQLYFTYCESWEGFQICDDYHHGKNVRHDNNHWEDDHDHGRFSVEHGAIVEYDFRGKSQRLSQFGNFLEF